MARKNGKGESESGARERLLAAALDSFNDKGYAAASVRESVEAAGVTKPVLYYYFGSKEGIFLELMENSHRTFESLAQNLSAIEAPAPEKIISFCAELFDTSLQSLPLVRLMYAISYGPPQGAPHFDLDAFFLRLMELMRQLVSAGISAGELSGDSVDDVARSIIAMVTSAINEQLSARAARLDREGMIRMLQLLMDGIARN
jgi:TetR/AcrR family transcriptional regulator